MDMTLGKLQEIVRDREACVLQSMGLWRVKHDLVTEHNNNSNNNNNKGTCEETREASEMKKNA